MRIKFAVSGRHVHLTQETAELLGLDPKPVRELGVRGNYASDTRLFVGDLAFRLLLPFRKYDQFEVLASDCKRLEIKPCYRQSGKTEGVPKLPVFTAFSDHPVMVPAIVAIPHLHCPERYVLWGPANRLSTAEVVIYGPKHIVLHDVVVWPTPGCDEPVLHIDVDEAMGFGMCENNFVEAYIEHAWHAELAMVGG